MLSSFKRDKRNAGHHKPRPSQPAEPVPHRTGTRLTQRVQDPPAPSGWSRPLGAAQVIHPPQNGVAQQGNTAQQQEGDPFLGGFVLPNNSNNNLITSPSNSVVSLPNGSTQQGTPVAPPNVDKDECYAWFLAVDQDGNGQLSPEELRSALLNEGGLSFSTSTVKYLMGIFDLDGNGTIGFEEFEPLWRFMTQWRQMFDSFDLDRDGRIDAAELGQALAHYNLHVGQPILNMLVNKYGITASRNQRPGYPCVQMDLDHFVCACVVVRQMCELYDKCTVGGPRPGESQISRDQFLETVILLP